MPGFNIYKAKGILELVIKYKLPYFNTEQGMPARFHNDDLQWLVGHEDAQC